MIIRRKLRNKSIMRGAFPASVGVAKVYAEVGLKPYLQRELQDTPAFPRVDDRTGTRRRHGCATRLCQNCGSKASRTVRRVVGFVEIRVVPKGMKKVLPWARAARSGNLPSSGRPARRSIQV